jgi:hypothetical protein
MARRLMDGVCWWMLREHALSKAGFQGDLVVAWVEREEEALMLTSNIRGVKTMSEKENDIDWKESGNLLVVVTLIEIV